MRGFSMAGRLRKAPCAWRAGLWALVLGAVAVSGQRPAQAEPISYFQVEGVTYDADVPAPETVLGHGLGDRPVRHDRMVRYLEQIAGLSDRISVETIGYSHEGRPILFFVVTSPDNHANLDDLREKHLARLDPDAPNRAGDAPAVIWINYGVHGAESSGMDAAIPMLYHLAAAQGEATETMLSDGILLITAIFNPDGHTRRADHVERFGGVVDVTDPAHVQHQLWTDARTNHYWFDLNRQWLLLTQPEPQAWVAKWHHWKPYVTADYHEMGSNATYYFHPGEPKRRNPLIPERARELTLQIAEHHVEWLDSESRLYYSGQGFDNFYIGKGSTYPQVNGSLGILFEAGAARGGRIDSPSGERSYADNIRTHFRTSLTTVEGALDSRTQIEVYQRNYFRSALREAAADERRAFVFTTDGDSARLQRFVDMLRQHDIDVYPLAREVQAGGKTYAPGGSFIVPLAQPQYRMIRGIFDTVTEFEENIFYDVSGWTLPLAYDLDYAPIGEGSLTDRLRGAPDTSFSPELMDTAREAKAATKQAVPPEAAYGYVFDWAEYYAPRALYRLLTEEVLVRVATEPFTLPTTEGMRSFDRGAIFVPLARQSVEHGKIRELIAEIAAKDGVKVFAASSGSSAEEGSDLGGPSFDPVQEPKVVLLFDDGIASYDAGEIWHLLDFHMQMPVTLVRKDQAANLDWSGYTHVVIPGGFNVGLSERATERLQQWVREGGTLIGLRQAAAWAEEAMLGREDDEENGNGAPEGKGQGEDEASEGPLRYDFADLDLRDAEHVIGGAIFRGDLDTTHPLGYGYSDRLLPSHRNTTLTLQWPEGNPFAVVVAYDKDNPLLSGYASERRRKEIAGTPMTVAERLGAGTVILMTDNPAFRGTFLGTHKLFLNGLFFSKLISRPRGDYGAQ